MQFQVPQFLDVEDKVIGPLTIKQFLYVAGSIGIGYMCYRYIPILGAVFGIGFIILGGALGFYKPNNKPFANMIESAFNYIRNARLYVWRRKNTAQMPTELNLGNFQSTKHAGALPMVRAGSKLNDLTWSMDVDTKELPLEKTHSDSAII